MSFLALFYLCSCTTLPLGVSMFVNSSTQRPLFATVYLCCKVQWVECSYIRGTRFLHSKDNVVILFEVLLPCLF